MLLNVSIEEKEPLKILFPLNVTYFVQQTIVRDWNYKKCNRKYFSSITPFTTLHFVFPYVYPICYIYKFLKKIKCESNNIYICILVLPVLLKINDIDSSNQIFIGSWQYIPWEVKSSSNIASCCWTSIWPRINTQIKCHFTISKNLLRTISFDIELGETFYHIIRLHLSTCTYLSLFIFVESLEVAN